MVGRAVRWCNGKPLFLRRDPTLAVESTTPVLESPPHAAARAPGQRGPATLALEFRGEAREYFRIWAVNLCLTLLTLGIFSAWAKVRKKRYFYSHTLLDGTPFQYLGQPVPILKGRVVAAILFLVYYATSHLFTTLLPYVLAAGLVVAPWVVVRSAAFNARYSAYRNMTFGFEGTYVDALKTVYVWGLIPALVVGAIFDWWGNYYLAAGLFAVFGLAFPWWLRRLKAFIVGCSSYGGERGELAATGGQFFNVYFVAGLIMMAAGILTGVVGAAVFASASKTTELGVILVSLPVYAGYVLAFAYVQANVGNLVWNHTRLGPLRFQSTLRGTELAKLYLTNALAIVASLGLATPWAVIRTLKYRADNLRVNVEGNLADFHGGESSAVQASGAEVAEFFDLDLSL
jgi:uncharacterized membrane protein YjgN (DUF898 family)